MRRPGHVAFLILLLWSIAGCSAKAPTQAARVYREPDLVKPGSYHLEFLLTGQGTLAEYLRDEKTRNPDLKDFEVAGLLKLLRNAAPQLYLPVQSGAPICHLETNFKYCRGIELVADLQMYGDDTVVLNSSVYYHINLRLEGDHPNFFRAAKAQRDRGEFALPRHYYVGALLDAIQKALPILQEIATDYRKYIKTDHQVIEIVLTLEESPERALARQKDKTIKDTANLGGSVVILSALPNLSFWAGLTVSAFYSGGKTFWEVLEEEKDFDLSKRSLELDQVEFSYTSSFGRNFSHILRSSTEPVSDIIIRGIIVRLRPKEHADRIGTYPYQVLNFKPSDA
ncbi:MAG: hypothetical protein ACYC5X_11375 [Syntrophales bacterium]